LPPEITVYVRSTKIPIGETLVERLYPIKRGYGYRGSSLYKVKRQMMYNYVLPADHNALIEDVKLLCKRHGLRLKVIDVSKEDMMDPLILFQRIRRTLKGIKNLPAVETNRGARIRTPFSQDKLERFISELAFFKENANAS
jgi:hypothetical protein